MDYLTALAQHHGCAATADTGQQLADAFDLIQAHEQALGDRLLKFLHQKPNVRIIGRPDANPAHRVPTISFVVTGRNSADIPPLVDPHHIGIRYGHFYAVRLIEDLGLAAQNGVVRVSIVHYNTLEECDRLITCLDSIL